MAQHAERDGCCRQALQRGVQQCFCRARLRVELEEVGPVMGCGDCGKTPAFPDLGFDHGSCAMADRHGTGNLINGHQKDLERQNEPGIRSGTEPVLVPGILHSNRHGSGTRAKPAPPGKRRTVRRTGEHLRRDDPRPWLRSRIWGAPARGIPGTQS